MVKSKKQFSCYLIGNESLAIQCGDVLLAKHFKVLGIVSTHPAILAWAHQHNLRCFSSPAELSSHIKPCDYLFSIVNHEILTPPLLKHVKRLAINYHDALLPRYAGVHATSWAVLNQEQQHGITWHVVAKKIDAGDILKQKSVMIEPNETALSLNLKCYQAAIESFNELVDELIADTYQHQSQNLKQRTYYGYHQKIPGNGWVDWKTPAETLIRQFKALELGEHPNRLGCLKFMMGSDAYFIKGLELTHHQSKLLPGTLIKGHSKSLQIATSTHNVVITELHQTTLKDFIAKHKLESGYRFQSPSKKQSNAYETLSQIASKYEEFWISELQKQQPTTLPFLPNTLQKTSPFKPLASFKLNQKLRLSLKKQFPNIPIKDLLLTLCLIYLYRLQKQDIISLQLIDKRVLPDDKKLHSLVSDALPLNVGLQDHDTFKKVYQTLSHAIQEVKQRETYLVDIHARYPELSQYQPLAISIDLNESFDHRQKRLNPAHIQITHNEVRLYIQHEAINDHLKMIIQNIPGHLQTLLEAIVKTPKKSISQLPLLTSQEYQQIVVDWNKTETPFPHTKTITQLFEEQVERAPHNVAIVFNNQELTYLELNQRADQVAHHLIQNGIRENQFIAICLERSLEMIIGILSILKAGCAYVPIDPEYPTKRIRYILEDTEAKCLLTTSSLIKKLRKKFSAIEIIAIDKLTTLNKPVLAKTQSNSIAYVMYTSGSTGHPKGVIVTHQNIIKLVKDVSYVSIQPTDCFAQASNFAFDASTFEIWGALLNQARLVIISKENLLNPALFLNIIQKNNITHLWLTAALFNQFVALNPTPLYRIPNLLIGGEKLDIKTIQMYVRKKNPVQTLLNGYGPTEGTTFSTTYKITQKILKYDSVPIGKPINNTQCYVLDNQLQPLPIGMWGELHIGGLGVTKGYLNKPKLTKEKFIANPFKKTSKLYKTGDIVRWLPYGNLEYLGRNDDQVKIRGFRIELSEIEAAVQHCPFISQAVICVRETDDKKQLLVYFIRQTSTLKKSSLERDLQNYLKERLPAYMVPDHYIEVPSFPLTTNGKIDKKALLADYGIKLDIYHPIKEPTSEIERLLTETWKNVLKLEAISIDDNFFSLGCDSITAMQVVAKLYQHNITTSVKDIFQYPSIQTLARVIQTNQKISTQTVDFNQPFSLTPIQSWFFNLKLKYPEHFNQVCSLSIQQPIDVKRLEKCLQIIVLKHPSFWLCFSNKNRLCKQVYKKPQLSLSLLKTVNVDDASHTPQDWIKHYEHQLALTFNLQEGKLINAVLINDTKSLTTQLLIAAHHLIIDGVSWRIILEELAGLYHAPSLPNLKSITSAENYSYQQWVQSLHSYTKSNELEVEQTYWQSLPTALALPLDYPAGTNLEQSAVTLTKTLSEQDTQSLLQQLPTTYEIKLHELLIALLAKTVSTWCQSSSVLIDLESHGREELTSQHNLSQTVGWFTSLFPVGLTNLSGTLLEILSSVKNQLETISRHGIGYGLLRYLKKVPLPSRPMIAFNYWGQFDQLLDNQHFQFSELKLVSHPENQRTHIFNIDAVIKNKQLTIQWTYSQTLHKAKTIKSLFDHLIHDLQIILDQLTKSALTQPLANQMPHIIDQYSLSPLQAGLLFHAIQTSATEAYMVQLVWKNPPHIQLNLSCLKQAWQCLLDRHAIFRTSFTWQTGDEPLQQVHSSVKLPWTTYDWSKDESPEGFSARLNDFLKADRQAGFDFNQPPLLRITAIKLANQQYYLVITFHHILLDGWSLPLLIDELNTNYRSLLNHQSTGLTHEKPYRQYIESLTYQNNKKLEIFWKNYLKGFTEPTDLVINHPHPQQPLEPGFERMDLPVKLTNQIHNFCKQHQLTLNTFFQSLWALLLSRYSQMEDVVFGVTVTERNPKLMGSDQMIGLLINTLPLRINLKDNLTIKNFLKNTQDNFSGILDYHSTSLTDIQQWSDIPKGTSLFNSILVFENYPIRTHKNQLLKFDDFEIIDPTHYPLTCIIVPSKKIGIKIAYDKNQIETLTIKRMFGHLQTLLSEIIKNPNQNIHKINILTKEEYQQIVIDWNKTDSPYPIDKTIVDLFEEQVKKTPDHIAVTFENKKLTYKELNEKSNQLAHYLVKNQLRVSDSVAICIKKSFEMIIALLGTLKAGGFYIPIDPNCPTLRAQHILTDCKPSFIITQKNIFLKNEFKKFKYKKLFFTDEFKEISNLSHNNLNIKIKPSNLMYTIYTSGSTGQPKGVIVNHQAVVNLLYSVRSLIKPTSKDNFLSLTPITFDISGLEIYLPFTIGAHCTIANELSLKDGNKLKKIINDQQISILQATPMSYKMLIEAGWEGKKSLKLLCGGETLPKQLAQQLLTKANRVWNLYGPTETTIWSSSYLVNSLNKTSIPIGKALSNTKLYVLNKYLQPLPIGLIGELFIGGVGLAQGYLKNPELTSEKFIRINSSNLQNVRLYKTGDLVRWLPDGNLEYIGRIDDQKKINGYRIELNEIQSHLEKHSSVKQAAVIYHEKSNDHNYLITYLVPKSKISINIEEIKKYLKLRIPTYMIPSMFIKLDKIPVTPNGKIDKKALLHFIDENLERNKAKTKLIGNEEKKIAEIWKKVLNIDYQIDRKHNFFELGGNSLLALQVLSEIHRYYKVELPVRFLFDHTSVHEIANHIKKLYQDKSVLSAAMIDNHSAISMPHLIPLKHNGTKKPLFLIHPIGGTVFWYIPLIKYIDTDRPVYAIQDPAIGTKDIPFKNIEEMASFYIKTIKNIQKSGPYLLAGASAGANISVEMAYQLKRQNEQISFIGLFDGWAYYPQNLQNQEFFQKLMLKQLNSMKEMLVSTNIKNAEHLLKIQWQRSKIYSKYVPPCIPDQLTLFKAQKTLPIFRPIDSLYNHWEIYSTQRIELYEIPGDHETMFQEPNAAYLVTVLNKCLNKIENDCKITNQKFIVSET